MQRFMVEFFRNKEDQAKCVKFLDLMLSTEQNIRFCSAIGMTFSYISDPSGVIIIDNANMELGRMLVDIAGYKVRHQQWVEMK